MPTLLLAGALLPAAAVAAPAGDPPAGAAPERPAALAAGDCFIATAAWGTDLAPEVAALRRFRDRVLLSHAPGRRLAAWYYSISPPLAERLAEDPLLRWGVRALLTPLAMAVRYPLAATASAGLAVTGLIVALRAGRRRRRYWR